MGKIVEKMVNNKLYGIWKNIFCCHVTNTSFEKLDPLKIYWSAYTLISPMH